MSWKRSDRWDSETLPRVYHVTMDDVISPMLFSLLSLLLLDYRKSDRPHETELIGFGIHNRFS